MLPSVSLHWVAAPCFPCSTFVCELVFISSLFCSVSVYLFPSLFPTCLFLLYLFFYTYSLFICFVYILCVISSLLFPFVSFLFIPSTYVILNPLLPHRITLYSTPSYFIILNPLKYNQTLTSMHRFATHCNPHMYYTHSSLIRSNPLNFFPLLHSRCIAALCCLNVGTQHTAGPRQGNATNQQKAALLQKLRHRLRIDVIVLKTNLLP